MDKIKYGFENVKGTGHYLSPGRGGGRRIGEQNGRSVVTENPKGGSLKTLEGFKGGTSRKRKTWGGGGKSLQ